MRTTEGRRVEEGRRVDGGKREGRRVEKNCWEDGRVKMDNGHKGHIRGRVI